MKITFRGLTVLGTAVLVAIIIFYYLVGVKSYSSRSFSDFLTQDLDASLFFLLMLILPTVGFSIGVFLVLVGMKFGVLGGIFITGAVMFLHLAAAYALGHSFLRPKLTVFLGKRDRQVPSLPEKGGYGLAFLFMLVPGLPYAVKNYLLALSGLPFGQYAAIGWSVNFVLSIPFIVFGKAVVEKNFGILLLVLLVLLAGYLLLYRLQRRFALLRGLFLKDL